MANATRREALGAGLFTALAGVTAVAVAKPEAHAMQHAAHPDAELIDLCAQFCELERQFDATDFSARPGTLEAEAANREQRALTDAGDPILDRMHDLPTHTLEGFRARARAIVAFDKGELEKSDDARGMVWMLVRDLVGERDHS